MLKVFLVLLAYVVLGGLPGDGVGLGKGFFVPEPLLRLCLVFV